MFTILKCKLIIYNSVITFKSLREVIPLVFFQFFLMESVAVIIMTDVTL